MSTSKKVKIFILPLVAHGHVNPICGVVYELCQHPDVECTIYGVEEFRALMENTGARFRAYAHRNIADIDEPKITQAKSGRTKFIRDFTSKLCLSAYSIIPQLLNDIDLDAPDLIFYDSNFTVARFVLRTLRKRASSRVKFAEFYPNVVYSPRIFRENPDLFPFDFDLIFILMNIFYHQTKLGWQYNFRGINLFQKSFDEPGTLKIVAIFPELHPDRDDYDDSHKFVGQCVAEEARECEKRVDDKEMNAIFDEFPVTYESNSKTARRSKKQLILMSLGTFFNSKLDVFEYFFRDVAEYDQQPGRHFKSSEFQFVVSTGEPVLNQLNEKFARGELNLPSNVLLRARVPQLEILKRADLFITHNGQNSTSEAIKYGVPMVGIPIYGDQPIMSKRACDELSLGIRLDPFNLKPGDIGDAIDKVLSQDSVYRENADKVSKISAKYNGRRDGAKFLIDYARMKDDIYLARSLKSSRKSYLFKIGQIFAILLLAFIVYKVLAN